MAAKKRPPRPYFEIAGKKIPLIPYENFKQIDTKLVPRVTGMDWYEWIEKVGKHAFNHPAVKQGFLAVAIQRARSATIDEVEAFIDELPLVDGIKLVFPEASADADPPAEGETAAS